MDVSIANVLQECQRSVNVHRRGVVALHKLRQSETEREDGQFLAAFLAATDRVLAVYRREPAVERIVAFIVEFVASVANTPVKQQGPAGGDEAVVAPAFLSQFIRHLLQFANAKDKAPRLRVCQLVAGVMNNLADDVEIDDSLFDELDESLLARLRDKVPSVRVEAVKAVGRLQDPSNPDDPVVNEFVRMLTADTSKDVRHEVLSNICITNATLPVILQRTRDIKEEVRKLTYQTLAEKVKLRQLTISQRVALLQDGIKDRVPAVRGACMTLVCVWLRSLEYDVLEILGSIDVEDNQKLAESLLQQLFTVIDEAQNDPSLDHSTLQGLQSAVAFEIPTTAAELSPEAALFWRVRCQWLKEQTPPRLNELDEILPEVVDFCDLIAQVSVRHNPDADESDAEADADEPWFVRQQLFGLAKLLDFGDEAGRRQLTQLLLTMLTSLKTEDSTVEPMLRVLSTLYTDEGAYIRCVVEIINDVKDPLDDGAGSRSATLEKLRELRGSLEDLQQQLAACVAGEEFEQAAAIKSQMKALQAAEQEVAGRIDEESDLRRWLRCLEAAKYLFEFTNKSLATPELAGIVGSLVLPAVASAHPAVRLGGVQCLALCCIMDSTLVAVHAPLFAKALQADVPAIQLAAAKALGDLLTLFTKPAFEAATDDGDADADTVSFDAVVDLLVDVAGSSPDAVLKATIVEALARLMLLDRVQQQDVATLLLQEYLMPVEVELLREAASEDADAEELEALAEQLQAAARAQQCLAVFWSAYAVSSAAHQETILRSTPTVVSHMLDASLSSKQAKGKGKSLPKPVLDRVERGLQYLAFLLSESTSEGAARPNWHNSLLVPLLVEVAANPTGPFVRIIVKTAASLAVALPASTKAAACALISDCNDSVSDKPALRALGKLHNQLQAAEVTETAPATDEGEDGEGESKGSPAGEADTGASVETAVAAARDAVLVRFDALQAQGAAGASSKRGKKAGKKAAKPRRSRPSGGRRKLQTANASYVDNADSDSDDGGSRSAVAPEGTRARRSSTRASTARATARSALRQSIASVGSAGAASVASTATNRTAASGSSRSSGGQDVDEDEDSDFTM